MTRRAAILLAALVASSGLAPQPSGACSCLSRTRERQFASAVAVFVGTVVSVARPSAASPGGAVPATAAVRVRLGVDAVYKGAPGDPAEVRTPRGDAACGIGFVEGGRYLVFAGGRAGALSATVCGGTTKDVLALERAGVQPISGAIARQTPVTEAAAPAPGPGESSRTVPILVAAAALLAGGSILRRARRRRRDAG